MELTELKDRIISSFNGSEEDLNEVLDLIEKDRSVFPFNEYEHLICNFIEKGGFSFEQYIDIRSEYISENPNLWIFEISAPRGFGEKFAQTYIQAKCSKLKNPSKKLDTNYAGEYDLWLDGITIISIETAGNYLLIEYPTKTLSLSFTSIRGASDSDAMSDLAYDKIKKILEKL